MGRHDNRADLRHIPGYVRAQNGSIGGSRASGKPGRDVVLKVPLGTLVYQFDAPEQLDPGANWRQLCGGWDRRLVCDINVATHESVLLARGGTGGHGNTMRTPYEAQYGAEPQEAYYEIELKSIADVGFVGLPNVGKSTLLSATVGETPCCDLVGDAGVSISVADLPGIVECRLTQEFFRHIERTKALLYVMDVCNTTHTSMAESFASLREQVEAHGRGLASKPFAIVATKMDVNAGDAAKSVDAFCQHLKDMRIASKVLPTSAKLGLGIPNLVRVVRDLVGNFAQELVHRASEEFSVDGEDVPPDEGDEFAEHRDDATGR
ncbi:GTPase ObgE [Babesia caballi]|uniref:GTPase ObgE n=1 Tax=Babesia caballi TaxID=5871 RepID=A0AAV4LQX3_BABCB|nr:GTPase ObgE [Babesia caballi]